MDQAAQQVGVVIIGAGFAGLGMAIRLKQSAYQDFLVLEQAAVVGGCWRDNTYPGCACDIPGHLYGFSFFSKTDWSRKYAGQDEIHQYLQSCVEHFQLTPHVRLSHQVARLQFDDAQQQWLVHLTDGRTIQARVVVLGRGPLSIPKWPAITGLDRFPGPVFHSSRWQHQHDLQGKRIAVIGTGASAIQFIPHLAGLASQLTVFQRTPAWVVPRPDRVIGRREQALYRRWPGLQRAYRQWLFWVHELRYLGMADAKGWPHRLVEYLAGKHLRSQVPDPEKRRLLTPNYALGCKRVLLSNDYYPAMNQAHVKIVPAGLNAVEGRTLLAGDGSRHEVDVVVFGTGFEVAESLPPGWIVGPGGVDLGAQWLQQGMQAYRGVATTGMPNLFFLVGPNSGLGHNSLVLMIEAQIEHILQCIQHMQTQHAALCEVQPTAQQAFNEQVQQQLAGTVWASGCQSWYLDQHGRNTTLWPGSVVAYQKLMRTWSVSDYHWTNPGLQEDRVAASVADQPADVAAV
ncbi:cation diffusion facilitator CzcD-associated flavoprotein CzcO [Chitinivorax tropicus]|uniref:Cation diffusion facilitator CzcD-associated flavoprotein CzcO n=1 Tax=Chitinivorax tropicus TaxID=714531 RepID=A0A840ME37_9PROT|nr:NAD(P)/FAD-dependent oxidoreductase [Chitinivorax tropicus]MBB5017554.1 cation diffusion facilitator CzcD-associated flavoprotein CzcO [Chitinivorax tropicus]